MSRNPARPLRIELKALLKNEYHWFHIWRGKFRPVAEPDYSRYTHVAISNETSSS